MSAEFSLHTCKYSGTADLTEIKNLIARNRPAGWERDFPTAVDLEELFQDSEMAASTLLWRSSTGGLAAYAIVHFPYNNLRFEILENVWSEGLENEILTWAEGRMRAYYGCDLAAETLDGCCRVEDFHMTNFFLNNGFERQLVESLSYLADLSSPSSASSVLPPGFTLRCLNVEHELEEVVALHQSAYGTENFSLEDRRAVMSTSAYIPELDLVVEAPNGELAGNCICGIDQPRDDLLIREGFTDPVVVHPKYRGMGIAKAMLFTGLERLRKRGVLLVHLGTSSVNTSMQRAAEAVGFCIVARSVWYSKKMD